MASPMDNSLPVFLLFLALSLQIHARESQFFSKTSRFVAPATASTSSIAEEPAMALPPQSHIGYGLYGCDPDRYFPSSTGTAAKTNYKAETVPSTSANAEFSAESYENKGRNYAGHIPSSSTAAEHSTANKYIPSTFSDEEFNRGSYETKVPNYSNYDKQYGMSDTRFTENGKYFYDVDAERNSREYEQVKGSSERYGSYEYMNGEGGYLNNQEKKETQEDYVP